MAIITTIIISAFLFKMAEENKPLVSVSSRRTYTLEFKLGVLEWMKSHGSSVRGTARRFGIHRRMVQRWMEKESELNLAFVIDGAQRKKIHHQSGSKQPLFQELEGKLLSWLVSQRESGTMISDNKIKTQALIIAMNMGLDSFKASSGWMSSFKKRNKDFLCRDSANGSSTNCYPSVSIEEQNSPLKLSGEALLAHTNPNETIHLIFTDVSKCDQLKEHDDAFVYFDYQTPEHNYCKMDNVPTLQACTPEEWNVHQDIVLIDKDDEQVLCKLSLRVVYISR